jgi:Zn-dependent peptidase ImmA (M78 family)
MGAVGRARTVARSILKKHRITDPPIDVNKLIAAEAPGYRVIYEERWPADMSGLTNRTEKTIRINKKHPPLRQRFSMAHELGHICLDHETILPHRIEEETLGREFEQEADEFASELLMPIQMFKRAFSSTPNLDTLAQLFQVSTSAVSVRLLKLHLI